MDTQHQDNQQIMSGRGDDVEPRSVGRDHHDHAVQGMASTDAINEEQVGRSDPVAEQGSRNEQIAERESIVDVDMDKVEKPELPWAFIDCPTDDLVILIAHMLNRLMEHNDQVPLTTSHLTRFHSRAPPGISVLEYLRRIVRYTNLEKLPLLSLLAYIDTTCLSLPTFTLSSLTVHRFLISGVTAGSKALCDAFCTNAHYAKVGGIRVAELNALEREFLKITEWALCVPAELLQQYYTSLITSHGGYSQAEQPVESPFTTFPLPRHLPREAEMEPAGPKAAAGVESRTSETAAEPRRAATGSPDDPTGSDRSSSVATSTACSPEMVNTEGQGGSQDRDGMDLAPEGAGQNLTADKLSGWTKPENATASSSRSSPQPSPAKSAEPERSRHDSSRSRSSRGSSRSGNAPTRNEQGVAYRRRPAELSAADRTASSASFASGNSHSGSSGSFHPSTEARGAASPRVDATPASGGGSGSAEAVMPPRRQSGQIGSLPFPVVEGGTVLAERELGGSEVTRRLRESLNRTPSDGRLHAVSLGHVHAPRLDPSQSRRNSGDVDATMSGSGGGLGFLGGLLRRRRTGSHTVHDETTSSGTLSRETASRDASMDGDVSDSRGGASKTAARNIPPSSTAVDRPLAGSPRERSRASSSVPHPGSVTPLIRSRSTGDFQAGEASHGGDARATDGSGTMSGAKRARRDIDFEPQRVQTDGLEAAAG